MSTEQLAEGVVRGLLGMLGMAAVPGTTELAERLLGRDAIVQSHRVTRPAVEFYAGRRRAVLPRGTSTEVGHWHLAHALAGHVLEGDGFAGIELATLRPLVAAALVLPAASVSRYLPRVGTEGVARALRLPFAAVYLREAELLRVPTALVVPGRYARVRGDDAGRLPTDLAALELLAGRTGIGVRKIAAPDEGGVIVRAA